jgi:AcrR family transcriptional regulator
MVPGVAATSFTDGRAARAARTRDAVVEALLALIDEGSLRPTAREVAARAGVSLRSVYVHFDDLEDLFTAAAHHHFERIRDLVQAVPNDGPLDDRIEAFVAQRGRILDATDNVRRAAVLQEPFSPAIADVLHLARQLSRAEIEHVFAQELARQEGSDREQLVVAVEIAASGGTWEGLRRHHRLSTSAAREVMARTLRGLLSEGA